MIVPTNEKEVRQFTQDSIRDASHERNLFGAYAARCRCYYIGSQWIQQQSAPWHFQRWVREATNWVGQQGPIRATINRTTKHTIQVASATSPEKLWVDGLPPDHSEGIIEARMADMMETTANAVIDDCGLLRIARRANFERTIDGAHGIGLAMDTWADTLDIQGQQVAVQNRKVRAFDFDYTRLTLDPHNQSPDLRDHDSIIYSEVFTESKLNRYFGQETMSRIDTKSLKTIESLMPVEMQFYALSGGTMYAPYHAFRHTKGALVHFLHFRSASGRYDTQFAVIEAKPTGDSRDKDHIVVGMDDPRSAWGGDGLPYIVLYGHFRPTSRMPVSDVGMMIDDQDKLNLTASMYFQQLYDFTQYSYLVDKGFFGSRADDNQIREQLQSRVIIGDNQRGAAPPALMLRPNPSATVSADMDRFEGAMREQVFRTESHQGKLKSHVTTTQFTGTVELTQIPLDDRITSDIAEYERIISVATGTTLGNLQASSPYTARLLTEAGMSPDDLGLLARTDPARIPATLSIRQETVRRRSRSQRKQDLVDAVSLGAIDGRMFAKTMASDLDMPLSSLDKQALRFGRDTAYSVMMGEPFTPLPLGLYSEAVIDEMRRAMMSDAAKRIPNAYQNLAQAIITQQEMMAAEMGGGEVGGQAGAQPQEGDPMQDGSLADLIGGITPADLEQV
jgi:hypothetical protein